MTTHKQAAMTTIERAHTINGAACFFLDFVHRVKVGSLSIRRGRKNRAN
jgi:hypothetical protein